MSNYHRIAANREDTAYQTALLEIRKEAPQVMTIRGRLLNVTLDPTKSEYGFLTIMTPHRQFRSVTRTFRLTSYDAAWPEFVALYDEEKLCAEIEVSFTADGYSRKDTKEWVQTECVVAIEA